MKPYFLWVLMIPAILCASSVINPGGNTGTTLPLPPGATNYIQNSSTLQSGATAYPDFLQAGTSATIGLNGLAVLGHLDVNRPDLTGFSGAMRLFFDPSSAGTTNGLVLQNNNNIAASFPLSYEGSAGFPVVQQSGAAQTNPTFTVSVSSCNPSGTVTCAPQQRTSTGGNADGRMVFNNQLGSEVMRVSISSVGISGATGLNVTYGITVATFTSNAFNTTSTSATVTGSAGLTVVNSLISGAHTINGTANTLMFNGATTQSQYLTYNNTGGTSYFGVEGSVGGGLATGSSPYALVLSPANNQKLQLGYNAGLGVSMSIDTLGQLTENKVSTFLSSVTVGAAAYLGSNGNAVTISSNAVTAGATFYQNGNASISGDVGISTNGANGRFSVVCNTADPFCLTMSTSTTGLPIMTVSSTPVQSPSDFILNITSPTTGTTLIGFQFSGHMVSSGTVPTVANNACGSTTQGVVDGNSTDFAGFVTAGTISPTSCAITFSNVFANKPICVISDNSTTVTADVSAVSTTGFTVSLSAGSSGIIIYWICLGAKG